MPTKIQIRRDSLANWTSLNPVLAAGEIGYLLPDAGNGVVGSFKIGDGITAWAALPTYNTGTGGGGVGGGANIANGSSNVNIAVASGNVTVGVGGIANVATFKNTGANITGTLGVSGVTNLSSDLNVTGTSNLGANGNVIITGGTNGQVLTTNGSGGLSWSTPTGTGSGITSITGTTNQIAVGGTATVPILSISTDPVLSGNVTAARFIGAGNNLSNIQGANITGAVANATYATSAGTAASATVANSANGVAGANVVGAVGVATFATTANAVAGANVTGQVGNALVAGTVYTAAQPAITSVGTLTALTVNGPLNVSPANLNVSGGINGQVLTTGGAGDLSWTTITAGPVVTAGDSGKAPVLDGVGKLDITTIPEGVVLSVNGVTPDADGDVAIASVFTSTTVGALAARPTTANDGDIYIVAGDSVPANDGFTYIWSGGVGGAWYQIQENLASYDNRYVNLSGDTMTGALKLIPPVHGTDAATKAYVDAAVIAGPGTLYASAITSNIAGNLASTNVQAALNELDTEKVRKSGDTMTGALTLSGAPTAGTNQAATAAYVDNSVSGKLNLTGGTLSGTLNVPTVNVTANATLGAAANVHITGGTNGQFLQTNGTGNLVWSNVAATNVTFTAGGSIIATTVQGAITELDTEKLSVSGGTMTGAITQTVAPTLANHLITMTYANTNYVNVGGDTMTGNLILNSAPYTGTGDALRATTKAYVDSRVGGGVSFVTTPVNSTATGIVGQLAVDGSHFYSYNGTQWKRSGTESFGLAGQPQIGGVPILPANHIINTPVGPDITTPLDSGMAPVNPNVIPAPVHPRSDDFVNALNLGQTLYNRPARLQFDMGSGTYDNSLFGIPFNFIPPTGSTVSSIGVGPAGVRTYLTSPIIENLGSGDFTMNPGPDNTISLYYWVESDEGPYSIPIPWKGTGWNPNGTLTNTTVDANGSLITIPQGGPLVEGYLPGGIIDNNVKGDRHLIVIDGRTGMLYETGEVEYDAATDRWAGAAGAVFDLNSNKLRTDTWTSADASGLPILPFLVRYEEIVEGEIKHALRFTARWTRKSYAWPATHQAAPRFNRPNLDDAAENQTWRNAVVNWNLAYAKWIRKEAGATFPGRPPYVASWQAGDANINNAADTRWTQWNAAWQTAGSPNPPGNYIYDSTYYIEDPLNSDNYRPVFGPPVAQYYAGSEYDLRWPRMGERFRLRADFDDVYYVKPGDKNPVTGLVVPAGVRWSTTNRIIIRALKKYGMIVTDNGNSWFTQGVPDPRWDNEDLSLIKGIEVSGVKYGIFGENFEAVETASWQVQDGYAEARPK